MGLKLTDWECNRCGRKWPVPEGVKFTCICQSSVPTKQAPRRDAVKNPCVHLLEPIRSEKCGSCGGKVSIKVLGCALKGECTQGNCSGKGCLPGIACCGNCLSYAPRKSFATPLPAIETRNLLYHVCPLASNDVWRHNVHQLLKRAELFNGRRVIAIACGQGMLPPTDVRRVFERAGGVWEFLELPNDRELREVATFLPLLLSVANTDPTQATFYAHTKGNSTADHPKGAEYWRNAMYHELLDKWSSCEAVLKDHAFVGCHKMVWEEGSKSPYPSGLQHGRFMLAGTFYWFRHDLVFGRQWRNIPLNRYGAEAWPAGLFEPHEVASVFQLWDEKNFWGNSPYNPNIYKQPIADEPLPPEPSPIEIPSESWDEYLKPRVPPVEISSTLVMRPSVPGPKTVLVIGAYRGGTSFIGELINELGVSLGKITSRRAEPWAYDNFEDEELRDAMRKENWGRIAEVIAERNSSPTWAYKWPGSVMHLDRLLPLLRNPHLIVVTRDPLAAYSGEDARSANPAFTIHAARFHSNKVLDCLTRTVAPTLAVSYERGKVARGEVKEAIRSFLN